MIEKTALFVFILILLLYYFLYKKFLYKIGKTKLFIIGLIFAIVPIVYLISLMILQESLLYCTLIPFSLAGFEPIFLRNMLGTLIGVSPWLGLFTCIPIFKKNKVYSVIIAILSVISIVLIGLATFCTQF